jgi:multicomponent Na+:H+ antiporter subunit A
VVDFRGYDTMGEITVLTIAAIGVYTLIKLKREPRQP